MTSITRRGLGTDLSTRRVDDVRDLLPNVDNPSPLVRVNRVLAERDLDLYLKLEWLNPFGSIKDRTAAFLIDGLERRGLLSGRELVDARRFAG